MSFSKQTSSDRLFQFIVGFITIFGFIIRFRVLGNIGPYPAEWYVVHIVTDYSVSQYLSRIFLEFKPAYQPAFFLIEKIAWNFSETFSALQIPPMLFGTLSIPAIAWSAKKYLGRKAGIIAATMLAASIYQIEMSVSLRPYSLVLFLSILSGYFMDGMPDSRRRIYLAVTNFLLMMTHLHPVLFIIPQYAVLTWYEYTNIKPRQKSLLKYFPELVGIGILILLRIPMIESKIGSGYKTGFKILNPYSVYYQFTNELVINQILWFVIAGFLSYSIFRAVRKGALKASIPHPKLYFSWKATVLITPLSLMLIAVSVGVLNSPRYIVFISVPLILLSAWFISAAPKACTAFFCLLLLIVSAVNCMENPSLKKPTMDLTPIIQYAASSKDPVLVFFGENRKQIVRRYYEKKIGLKYPNFFCFNMNDIKDNTFYIKEDGLYYQIFLGGPGEQRLRESFKQHGYDLIQTDIRLDISDRKRYFYRIRKISTASD